MMNLFVMRKNTPFILISLKTEIFTEQKKKYKNDFK